MAPKGVNAKQAAGRERKASNAAAKQAVLDKEREKQEAAEWKKGSNARGAARAESAAQKADEAVRKRREKAELLAAEDDEMGPTSRKAKANLKKAGATTSGRKKKKNNDLSLLESTLVGDADKKEKAAKKAARLKKEREDRLLSAQAKNKESEQQQDPLLANTEQQLGGTLQNETDGRLNAPLDSDGGHTGIDSALNALSVNDGGDGKDKHPEKRMKALHRAFEERMMPKVKEEHPGLRMSQYKERVFELWKKSPENPMNAIGE